MENISYLSTRGGKDGLTASQAILKGLADDGGLFVPKMFPKLDKSLEELIGLSYQDLAYEILKLFLSDYTEQEIRYCVNNAYDEKFDTEKIAPLVAASGQYFLELFHGKTLAFKDMALSILPYLLKTAAKKNGMDKKIIILTATSGDTGKAALEGFADVDGTGIIVFYPENGVSAVQERQMTTQEGDNTHVIGVKGNFDDAQTGVKKIFSDKEFAEELSQKDYVFSSANSINIGRLLPQVVYYFYAYGQMVQNEGLALGEKVNFTVPTGNFGNILAGYYAKKIGLPIDKLICASNDNKVLYDFFRTGEYNKNREFILTVSPSMDILVSSNLERLLYHTSEDTGKTKELMESLNDIGRYTFSGIDGDIIALWASEEETFIGIKEMYEKDYIMDTHTAVAYVALKKYAEESGDTTKNIIVSTASPFKFSEGVCSAIDGKYNGQEAFALLDTLAELNHSDIPVRIKGLDKKEVRHHKVCGKDHMKNIVKDILD